MKSKKFNQTRTYNIALLLFAAAALFTALTVQPAISLWLNATLALVLIAMAGFAGGALANKQNEQPQKQKENRQLGNGLIDVGDRTVTWLNGGKQTNIEAIAAFYRDIYIEDHDVVKNTIQEVSEQQRAVSVDYRVVVDENQLLEWCHIVLYPNTENKQLVNFTIFSGRQNKQQRNYLRKRYGVTGELNEKLAAREIEIKHLKNTANFHQGLLHTTTWGLQDSLTALQLQINNVRHWLKQSEYEPMTNSEAINNAENELINVEHSLDHLTTTLLRLLDAYELSRNTLEIHPEASILQETVLPVVKGLQNIAPLKKAEFHYTDIEKIVALYTDSGRLRQVVAGLADYAYDTVSKKGEIRWHTEVRNEDVIITIGNDGEVLTEEQQQKLFEPYVNFDSVTEPSSAAQMINMHICHELTLLLGGDLYYDHKQKQRNEFTLVIPIQLAKEKTMHMR